MTQQVSLNIQGRGQSPEKNDVIKTTDIFEADSLVPGQVPTLREDTTITVQPDPNGSSQKSQVQTSPNPKDIMQMSTAFENYMWGTGLSLDAAAVQLGETLSETKKLAISAESQWRRERPMVEQLAVESLGEKLKAGIRKVIEFLKAFFKRIRDWFKGERGRAAAEQVKKAKEAAAEPMPEGFEEVVKKASDDAFAEGSAFATVNTAGAEHQANADLQKQFREANTKLNESMEAVQKAGSDIEATSKQVEQMVAMAKEVNAILDEINQPKDPFVNDLSREKVEKFYRQFREWYGKRSDYVIEGDYIVEAEPKIEDIAAFIESLEDPDVGSAMAQALHTAARASRNVQKQVQTETKLAGAVGSIESKFAKGKANAEDVESRDISKENHVEPDPSAEPITQEPGDNSTGLDANSTGSDPLDPAGAAPEAMNRTADDDGDQGNPDVSLNDPTYLDGESPDMSDEEVGQLIDQRAEDLAVAAESLSSQKRVLTKLQKNRVISVGFVTESIQETGENLFADPRHYTQYPSRTGYDLAVESIGTKIKEGAIKLKDKIVAFLKRLWAWLKGLFSKRKSKVEEIIKEAKEEQAEVKEVVKQAEEAVKAAGEDPKKSIKEILEANGIVSKKPEPKQDTTPPAMAREVEKVQPAEEGPANAVYELVGLQSAESVANFIMDVDHGLQAIIKANESLDKSQKALKDAFDTQDGVAAIRIAEEHVKRVMEIWEETQSFEPNPARGNQELIKALKAEPSVESIGRAANLLARLKQETYQTIQAAVSSDTGSDALQAYQSIVENLPERSGEEFMTAVTKMGRVYRRYIQALAGTVDWAMSRTDQYFPVTPLMEVERQLVAKLSKGGSSAEPTKGDEAPANESYRESGRRVPYWERSAKK